MKLENASLRLFFCTT